MAAPDPTKPGCAILIVPLKHVAALIKCAVKTPTAAKRPYVSTVPAPHGIICSWPDSDCCPSVVPGAESLCVAYL